MRRYYSSREVCEILGISQRTFRRWVSEGRIRAVKVNDRWRVPEEELKRLVGAPPEPRGTRVVIYVHTVLSGQAGTDRLKLYELEEEARVLKNHAELKGWQIVNVIRDIDTVEEERNGLSRMLNMARNGEFDILLVYSRMDAFGMCYRFIEELLSVYGIRMTSIRG